MSKQMSGHKKSFKQFFCKHRMKMMVAMLSISSSCLEQASEVQSTIFLSSIKMGRIQLAISRNGNKVHPTMFGMNVMEFSHLQFLNMEKKNYMKQQQMGCYKTLQSLKP